jgi:hypothetical protein
MLCMLCMLSAGGTKLWITQFGVVVLIFMYLNFCTLVELSRSAL